MFRNTAKMGQDINRKRPTQHRSRLFSKSPTQNSATDWLQIIEATYEIVIASDALDEVYCTYVY